VLTKPRQRQGPLNPSRRQPLSAGLNPAWQPSLDAQDHATSPIQRDKLIRAEREKAGDDRSARLRIATLRCRPA